MQLLTWLNQKDIMHKTTTNYKIKVEEVLNRDDHYHLFGYIGTHKLDLVLERSSLRHIMGIIDNAINVGV